MLATCGGADALARTEDGAFPPIRREKANGWGTKQERQDLTGLLLNYFLPGGFAGVPACGWDGF